MKRLGSQAVGWRCFFICVFDLLFFICEANFLFFATPNTNLSAGIWLLVSPRQTRKHHKEYRGLSNGSFRAYNNPFLDDFRLPRILVRMPRLDCRRCLAWFVHHQALERIAVR
jgi:hypothetical protein